ncbi:MAG TPA: YihY/virulence factor BrkB family protein [Phycisphaerae bacterium]|nr:YihY/virulence factor BrkB family protein [Phycisphaerae bacterium]
MADDKSRKNAPHKGMSLWQVLKTTVSEWSEDRASRLAAAFAYYAIFSIGPILLITLTVLGWMLGPKAASDSLRPQLRQFFGEKAAEFIQSMVAKAGYSPGFSFAGIISLVLLLYAATNLFTSLQDALNTIFDVEPKPGRGWRGILNDRFLSFIMVGIVGIFVLASIVLSTFLAAIAGNLSVGNPAVTAFLMQAISFIISAIIFTGIFSLIFKFLPDIKIDWRDTLVGSAVTAILFTLARIGLGYYLAHSSTAGPFGAAGSLVIVMLFIYYSSQILFFGAEFTQVWAQRNGKKVRPSDNAVTIDPKFTKTTEGTSPATNSSGATGSRRHYDTVRQSHGGRAAAPSSSPQHDGSNPYAHMGYQQIGWGKDAPTPPPPAPAGKSSKTGKMAKWAAVAAVPAAFLWVRHKMHSEE